MPDIEIILLSPKSVLLVPTTASHGPRAFGVGVVASHVTPSLSHYFPLFLPMNSPLPPTEKSNIAQYLQVGHNPFVSAAMRAAYVPCGGGGGGGYV